MLRGDIQMQPSGGGYGVLWFSFLESATNAPLYVLNSNFLFRHCACSTLNQILLCARFAQSGSVPAGLLVASNKSLSQRRAV